MLSKIQLKFIQDVKDAIQNETYDDLMIEEWEIIEDLLEIIDEQQFQIQELCTHEITNMNRCIGCGKILNGDY